MTAERWPSPRDDLAGLEGYHSPQLDVAVRLNTNESPYPPPPAFVDRWLDELRTVPLHRYPDRRAAALRAALAARHAQPVERVLCANGSNEILQCLLLAYGGTARRALVFEPTYALHRHIARITGTPIVTAARTDSHHVDPVAAAAAIAEYRPSVVLLCSPNNPTGTEDPVEVVDAVCAAATAVGALTVVDEAYGEFARASATSLIGDARPLVVVRTFSKVWSLAALRLGFALGPATVIDALTAVVLPYHLDAATQIAGRLALEFAPEMEARVARLVEERERLLGALADQPGVTALPSGANFVLVRVDGDAQAVWRGLVDRDVLVRDFSRWPGVEGCLRVTVGTPAENDAFLTALRAVLREHGAP